MRNNLEVSVFVLIFDNKLLFFMKKWLMSVKLLFIAENYLVFACVLNKCLLSLQHQKYASMPATKWVGIWN